jgi:tRNA threonylcarbamoyladenosine biosynthesis protein TsaB
LQEILAQAQLSVADLDLIAVTTGPGTFSGTRIGLAAARALAIVAPVPVLGLTSLAVLATAVPSALAAGRPVWAVIDARRGEFYGQGFSYERAGKLTPLAAPCRWPQDNIGDLVGLDSSCLLVGSGAEMALADLPHCQAAAVASSPDARVMLAMAEDYCASGEVLPKALPSPLYLRPPDAKLPTASSLV